jgi:XTP/dITP diphosphohydrolase
MHKILIVGTRNPKKLLELKDLLRNVAVEVLDISSFPAAPEIVEDGQTFAENAAKKAVGLARALGHWLIGEDSGLVVPALGGEPGVHSARYAGRQGNDEANNLLLLKKLEHFPDEKREAFYVCSIALSNPTGEIVAQAEGRCAGRIIRDCRGAGGFGYDPLFLIPEYHQTLGELSLRVKQALSHRSRAVAQLVPLIRRHCAVDP